MSFSIYLSDFGLTQNLTCQNKISYMLCEKLKLKNYEKKYLFIFKIVEIVLDV